MSLVFGTRVTIFVAAVTGVIVIGAAYLSASDGATAPLNTPITVTGPDGVCKKITNASATGLSEYIPTASIGEWQSFVANPPAGVTLQDCVNAQCSLSSNVSTRLPLASFDSDGFDCGDSVPCINMGPIYSDGNYLYAAGWTQLHALRYQDGAWQVGGSYTGPDYEFLGITGNNAGTLFVAGNTHTLYSCCNTGFVKALTYDGSLFHEVASIPQPTQLPSMHFSNGTMFVSTSLYDSSTNQYMYALTFNGSAFKEISRWSYDSSARGPALNIWSTRGSSIVQLPLFVSGGELFRFTGGVFSYLSQLGGPGVNGMTDTSDLPGWGMALSDIVLPGLDFGQHVIIAAGSNLNAYTIGADKGLALAATYAVPDGSHIMSIATDGSRIYASIGYGSTVRIAAFSFDGTTFTQRGSLTLPPVTTFGNHPVLLAYGNGYLYAVQHNWGVFAIKFSCI